ncbi:MAG: hypothetical protein CL610_26030 [Anaerolineaceae bacterium]|nr:hypothetical protein [Anaerolineaceae bacterium]
MMTMYSVGQQRLYHQQIARPRLDTPQAVVGWLGVLQGQDYPGAKWSIGLRLPGSTDAGIEQAIADRQIVRTWVMRGTLHLVAAQDVRWMMDLIGPRILAQMARRYRQLDIDEASVTRSHDVLLKALAGGQQLTRRALFPILEDNGISTAGQRGIHLLQQASLAGLLVQTTVKNNNPLFMRVDDMLPDAKTIPRDAALAELARRYFTSRGPATLKDFAWWTGMLMTDVRAGLEAVKDTLVEAVIDGTSYWLSPDSVPASASPTAYAPPGFDEYLLGYKDRDAVLDPQHVFKVVPGKNGIFFPTMVVDGRVVGVWKRTFKKGKVIVTTAPFDPLGEPEMAAFATAVQRYGDFMGMPVVLESA